MNNYNILLVVLDIMKTTKKHAIWFHDPLATALLHSNTLVSPNSVNCSPAGYTTTLILKTIAFTHFFKDCFNEK